MVLRDAQKRGYRLLEELSEVGELPRNGRLGTFKITIGNRPQNIVTCIFSYEVWMGIDPTGQDKIYEAIKKRVNYKDSKKAEESFYRAAVLGGEYIYPSMKIKIVYSVNGKKIKEAVRIVRKVKFDHAKDRLEEIEAIEDKLQNEPIRLFSQLSAKTMNKDLSEYEVRTEVRSSTMGNSKSWESAGFDLKNISAYDD